MTASFESFYEENKEVLAKNYPGLKLLRLVREFDECESLSIDEFKEKVLKGIPLEYISNISHFYKDSFYVDENVLIPRSETEILVEESISYIKKNNVESVFEIGTGSGCIAISVALECPEVKIKASDISEDALKIAKKNLKSRDVNVEFILQDLIDQGSYDFIISNPPYIKELEDKDGVHLQTDTFEPHLALYLKDDIYESWFDNLFSKVASSLNSNGAFFMEGHEDHLENLSIAAKKYFSKVTIKKDYSSRDRFLFCYKE